MSRMGTGLLALSLAASAQALEGEVHGMLDVRLAVSGSDSGWLFNGLDKQRFDENHDGLRLGQAVLSGKLTAGTVMGFVPFHDLIADYRSWYVLASRQFGAHRLTARYDWFEVRDRDGKAADPNEEYGKALALGWSWAFCKRMDASLEWLRVDSDREGRTLQGLAADKTEDLLQGRVRRWF